MLFIELTARCNEYCLHCYAESGPERHETLSLAEVRSVLEQAKTFGNPSLQFTGGDPLLHPDIPAALHLARELDYQDIEIYTNGLVLNDRLLNRLLPFAPRFAFSFYSDKAAIHDRITRVPGSFKRTLAAICRTKNAGLDVRIGVSIMPENQGQEQRILRFLKNEAGLPPANIHFDTVNAVGRGDSIKDKPESSGGNPDHYSREQESPSRTQETKWQGKLCVAASGNVYPCIFSRRNLLGNIRRQALTGILHQLDQRCLPAPSMARWKQCRQSLSCRDCQFISYALGMESEHAAA